VSNPMLEIHKLSKRFGGLLANNDISLRVPRGEIHAIIGPNGAGKSTLISQIAGELPPTSGTIAIDGMDVTGLPAHQRARLGLARCFQITSIFPSFSAAENVAIAAQAMQGHSYRFWRPADSISELNRAAAEVLLQVGLESGKTRNAGSLSHGEHRQLEIAMALVSRPKLLLLDEPTAGMGREESQRLVGLLKEVGAGQTIILIEHDIDAVFALADRITVLANGRVLASDVPAAIRASQAIREAYLGNDAPSP
jgi:branched-chain amino acid transport system ATP-binding protein